MSNNIKPTFANGKICYMEIPALSIEESATFYRTVFDWRIRDDNEGNVSFDDTAGQVSGMWVTNRKPATEPGLMVSIMVYDLQKTTHMIEANGGKILRSGDYIPSDKIAFFQDPAGNTFCLYQHNRKS